MRKAEGILCDIRTSKEFLNCWRSGNDIVCILGKYGIETTKGEVNRCFAKNYDQIDVEHGFESMFHHCHYVWNVGGGGGENNTCFISSLVRYQCNNAKSTMLSLPAITLPNSGSSHLTNTRHITNQLALVNNGLNSTQRQRLIVGSPTAMANGSYSHDSHIVGCFKITDTTWTHSKTCDLFLTSAWGMLKKTITFSRPKYHCEIARHSIELAWGYVEQ